MLEPAVPPNEARRLATLRGLNILDTPHEERFDRITRLAQRLLNVPIVLVSLIDANRQWFKSCLGLDASETPRSISFCGHAILDDKLFVIPDALLDPRFADNPLVAGAPHIRFYAGQPLKALDGCRLGTLCVIDRKPHHLTQEQRDSLHDLASLVENELNSMDIKDATRELINSQNRLSAVLENILDGIITINDRGIVESFNQSAVKIFGYVAAEVIGNNIKMLMPEPYHGEHDGYLHHFTTTGEKKVIGIGREVTGKRKDGSTFPMDLAVSEMQLGDTRMFTGIVRDITERKRSEEDFANISRLSKAVVDGADHLIITTDINGVILSFNHAAEINLGYRAEELVGKSSPAVFHVPEEVVRRAQELTASGLAVEPGFEVFVALARRQGKGDTREWTYQRKDGSHFLVSLTVSALRDTKGEITAFLGIATDITERKQVEMIQAQFSVIIESSTDAIMSKSLDGIVTSWNPAAERMFGYGADEMIGKPMALLIPPDRSEEEPQILAKIRRGEHIEHFETMRRRKNGEIFPISVTISPMRDRSGVIIGASKIARDISERVKIERMKSEFISTVSHELRTPLTSIRGSLGLIAGGVAGELPTQVKTLVDIAHKNSERLILLVNDILDMEKIEAGKMVFRLAPTGVAPLLRQAVESNRAYGVQYKVAYELAENLADVMVNVDANRLLQVLANLLSNAAKFSPAGGKVIVAATNDGQRVRISVSDHGGGIPEQFRSQIFQKFAQADSSDTRKKGGTGLGLSITKAIVEQMGGSIGFESQPNVLTTFFIEFPIWQESAAVAPVVSEVDTRKRVLICEDDTDIANLLCLMLENAGLIADITYTAAQAKQLLAQRHYAAMTLDLGLPDQNGIALIRELRVAKETANLPILVVSANAVEGRQELNGEAFSVIDWISKPINQEHLVSALRRAMGQVSHERPRVLHVEDDLDIVRVVSGIVGDVAEVENAQYLGDAQRMLAGKYYDLVILDLSLPDGSGMELLPMLNLATPPIPVLVFSANEMGLEEMQRVKSALVKSRTDNTQLLDTIKRLIQIE